MMVFYRFMIMHGQYLKREIPFILFVSTREVGNNGYMTWSQIREIAKEKFVHIGHQAAILMNI